MGALMSYRCPRCATSFMVASGGGFTFDLLHCETCGMPETVRHEELGEIHLGYVKGLGMPYAIARAEQDARIQAEYPGPALTEAEYHAAVEATLRPCPCGGRFTYGAPSRCPGCRTPTSECEPDEGSTATFD